MASSKEEEEFGLLEEDEKEEEEAGLLEKEKKSEDEDKENTTCGQKEKDPIIEAIGEFGRYQLFVCCVGLLIMIPHSWLSLSLKFVARRTNFTCSSEGHHPHHLSVVDPYYDNSCSSGHSNQTPCTSFLFDESQFRATIIQRWSLVCDKDGLESVAQSVFFAGCLAGVFLAGVLADRFGRLVVSVCLVLVYVVAGVGGGLTSSLATWLLLRFIMGAASIGMTTVRYTMQMELVSTNLRTWSSMMGGLGWNIGYMSLPVLAYYLPDMTSLEVVIGLAGLPFLSLYWLHTESPRWLLSIGREEEAKRVINKICSINGREAPKLKWASELTAHNKKEEEDGRIWSVLSYPGMRRNLSVLALAWFSFGMAYFGIALHTPEFGSSVYMVFFLGALSELPMTIVIPPLLNQLGRKRCLVGGLLTTALCLFMSGVASGLLHHQDWIVIALVTLGKLGTSLAFETGYVWTTELFPTLIRSSALSLCSSMARLGAIIAPLMVEIDKDNPMTPIMVYGCITLLTGILSLHISPDTRDWVSMPDSMDEGEARASA